MGLSNFERKKAGKLELGLGCQILEAGKLGDAPENLNFWKFYGIIEVAYYRTSAKIIPKYNPKFDREVKAGRATKI